MEKEEKASDFIAKVAEQIFIDIACRNPVMLPEGWEIDFIGNGQMVLSIPTLESKEEKKGVDEE